MQKYLFSALTKCIFVARNESADEASVAGCCDGKAKSFLMYKSAENEN